jgi:transcriptional regulator with XRE-family HTH domain
MSHGSRDKCDTHRMTMLAEDSSEATVAVVDPAPHPGLARRAAVTMATSERADVAFGSRATRPRETSGETRMPPNSKALLIECQFALGLSQQELGDLLGINRRTIQRWQESGFAPVPDMAETLAHALEPVRPDLAEQVRELARSDASETDATSPPVPATQEVIAAILRAAADAGGTSPEAIRPVVTAALLQAEAAGVDIHELVAALTTLR